MLHSKVIKKSKLKLKKKENIETTPKNTNKRKAKSKLLKLNAESASYHLFYQLIRTAIH